MLIDARYLHVLRKADGGCPKAQYIMADHYRHGIAMPKDREKSKHYYKLLASHDPQKLTFLNACYSALLRVIGYLEYIDNQDEEAAKYLKMAAAYIRQNYPPEEAEKKIEETNIEKYLSTIEL